MATLADTFIRTITTNTGVQAIDVRGYSGVVLQILLTGVTGGNFTFESSMDSTNGTDGNWLAMSGVRSNASNREATTGTLSASPAYSWDIPCSGAKFFRVRATAGTFGTATLNMVRDRDMVDNQPSVDATVSGSVSISGTPTVTNTPAAPTSHNANAAATTNATNVKNAAGTIYNLTVSNVSAAIKYVKLYNKASAPVPGTDTPILVIPVPATSVLVLPISAQGMRFSTGISYAITNAIGLLDATAVAVGDVQIKIDYL